MFDDRTQEQIKKEMLAEIDPSTGLSSMAGSFADSVAGPAARQICQVYQALPAVLSMLFVDETSGGYLDLVARDYHNLTRRAGTRASCPITLAGKAGTVIPAGTVFPTPSGLRFTLREKAVLGQSGTAVGELDAAEVGAVYNVGEGTITAMWVNLPGLESWENQAAIGGTDEESDQQMYDRIDEARKRPATSGNGWDYRRWALSVEGVGETKVVELPHGPGTVGLTVVDSNYAPASEEMVTAVLEAVKASKPIGATPSVAAAQSLEITVAATVTCSGVSQDEVSTELKSRMGEYLISLVRNKFGRIYYSPEEDLPYPLLYNRVLAMLLTIDGVENFSTLTVNGGTEDLSIPADHVPVLGEVTVT